MASRGPFDRLQFQGDRRWLSMAVIKVNERVAEFQIRSMMMLPMASRAGGDSLRRTGADGLTKTVKLRRTTVDRRCILTSQGICRGRRRILAIEKAGQAGNVFDAFEGPMAEACSRGRDDAQHGQCEQGDRDELWATDQFHQNSFLDEHIPGENKRSNTTSLIFRLWRVGTMSTFGKAVTAGVIGLF